MKFEVCVFYETCDDHRRCDGTGHVKTTSDRKHGGHGSKKIMYQSYTPKSQAGEYPEGIKYETPSN